MLRVECSELNISVTKIFVTLADHYAREQQEACTITITYVSTKDMIADLLTKPLAQAYFAKHAKKLVEQV